MIYKAFQLFTLLAVANPFCCCASEYLDEVFANNAVTHACCGNMSSQSNDAEQQGDGHPDKCPHQATKTHQQATQQDISGDYTFVYSAPTQVAVLCVDELLLKPDIDCLKVIPETASSYLAPGLQQVYCIYRI